MGYTLFIVLMIPAILLSLWAQFAVKHKFQKFSRVRASSGYTGAQAAKAMLARVGLGDSIGVELSRGFLSDHYDPTKRVLRLSPDVYNGTSVSALGVACHEAGHALQHAEKYKPLEYRNAIVPMASIGSNLSFVLIFIGLILMGLSASLGMGLAILGFVMFSFVVLFQLINLPVEFDASRRAKVCLSQMGLISGGREEQGVNEVLNAAAMTYVAATVTAVLQLLYWAHVIFGRR